VAEEKAIFSARKPKNLNTDGNIFNEQTAEADESEEENQHNGSQEEAEPEDEEEIDTQEWNEENETQQPRAVPRAKTLNRGVNLFAKFALEEGKILSCN
jgi:hypothetical protein